MSDTDDATDSIQERLLPHGGCFGCGSDNT